MLDKYIKFIKGVSVNPLGKWGVVLTTSSFITFVILEFARLVGFITATYVGLINYLVFPTLFVIGLILIPISWRKWKKQTGKSTKELLTMRFPDEDVKESFLGAGIIKTVGLFTVINILFLIIVSTQMLGFMDEPEFCGTACHSVMNPEWTTYRQSPHAHVACVECHVGEGTKALIDSKLNGAYQILSLTFHLYDQPIPTPVHQLRPARETCEKCHWPKKFYGTRLLNIVHYKEDEASTPQYTTLNMKIDVGKGEQKAGIHWHISKDNQVVYTSVNDQRKKMIWVELRDKDGSVHRFTNKGLTETGDRESEPRVMDCVDCHNRATHIYEEPAHAIDRRIHQGLIDRTLPYIKKVGLAAITRNYRNKADGMENIRKHVEGYYRRHYPNQIGQMYDKIDQAVQTLQAIYNRNIHPGMKITWGSYPNFIGHDGCFRCHNEKMVDDQGKAISHDCTTCHSILAMEEKEPFQYLKPVKEKQKNATMHKYLQDEFLNSFNE